MPFCGDEGECPEGVRCAVERFLVRCVALR